MCIRDRCGAPHVPPRLPPASPRAHRPLHRELGAAGSARASLYVYNTVEEVDAFVEAMRSTLEMFSELDD
eukprot:4091090-Prymnesium_polylepis.2